MTQFLTFAKLHQIRNVLMAGLCLVAILAISVPAHAVYLTSNGVFQLATSDPDPIQVPFNPPLVEITELSSGSGVLWTNQVNNPGSPFAIGSVIRSVGSFSLVQAINGDNLPTTLPNGSSVQIIFAVEGSIVSNSPTPTARFTGGSAFFVSRTTDNSPSLNLNNPLSFNLDDVFAKFDLLPQDVILPGPAGAAVAGLTNESAANLGGGASDGIFAFQEDLSFVPGPIAAGFANGVYTNPGLGAFDGAQWLRDVVNYGLGPNAFEGLAPFTDQTLHETPHALTGAQVAVLDAISAASYNFHGAFSQGGFTPTGFGAGTGDFSADISAEIYVITGVVPEPSSLVLFGLGAAAFGLVGYGKRRQTIAK